ncbi:unnamed protein product [Blepharisma stoltei]|uniref:Uncharacterized protein n=1 Tax=Blepharisma stoltei TaxID=1481888 RepID=A0AAU9JG53_9CILI|nr:unnamed protein product [Blepharisma stoltei]
MAIKILLIATLAFICLAIEEDSSQFLKEDACMNLLESMIRVEKAKFTEIFNLRPNLRKKELRDKLSENAFNFCTKQITDIEAHEILRAKSSKLPSYFHLLPLNIDSIHFPEDLSPDKAWPSHRRAIKKRLSRMRNNKMKNPRDL